MNPFLYLCILVGILFFATIVLVVNRIKKRKIISSTILCCQASALFLLFLVLLLIFSNLNTYQRLTYEADILEITIDKIREQGFELKLRYLNSKETPVARFNLSGDEWQLDARILKWKGWANLIGLDSYYQLDRLTGRYDSLEQANTLLPGAYRISGESKGLDLWKLNHLLKAGLPILDAYFGQSIFVPMIDNARYRVSISQTGLIVRPDNEVARQGLKSW